MNLNAIEAYEFIDFLSDQPDIPIDELSIRQINRLFIKHGPSTSTPGVYRKGQNEIIGFVTPDQGDVPGLMRSFALWLRQEDDMHPVLKAGFTHIHMVLVHPFWGGQRTNSQRPGHTYPPAKWVWIPQALIPRVRSVRHP